MDVARIYYRMEWCYKKGIGDLLEDEIEGIECTNLRFQNSARVLSEAYTTDEEFMDIIREIIDLGPIANLTRERINEFVNEKERDLPDRELLTNPLRNMKMHNDLEDYALEYLKLKGCKLVFKEQILDKKYKIDVVGCGDVDEIYGVECKVTYNDYNNNKHKLKSYSQNVDVFYLATFDKQVFDDVILWSDKKGVDIGIVLYSEDGNILFEREPKKNVRKFNKGTESTRKEINRRILSCFYKECMGSVEKLSCNEMMERLEKMLQIFKQNI